MGGIFLVPDIGHPPPPVCVHVVCVLGGVCFLVLALEMENSQERPEHGGDATTHRPPPPPCFPVHESFNDCFIFIGRGRVAGWPSPSSRRADEDPCSLEGNTLPELLEQSQLTRAINHTL